MNNLMMILALLQAPTPTPKPIAGVAQSGEIDGGLLKPLPTPKATATQKFLSVLNGGSPPLILFKDNGRTILTVADGDEPKGPCNLGDLVRAVKWDLEENHNRVVFYDNGPVGGITGQNATGVIDVCDSVPLPDQGVCRAEANLKYAKEERVRRAEWDKKWLDLRAELARCESGGAK